MSCAKSFLSDSEAPVVLEACNDEGAAAAGRFLEERGNEDGEACTDEEVAAAGRFATFITLFTPAAGRFATFIAGGFATFITLFTAAGRFATFITVSIISIVAGCFNAFIALFADFFIPAGFPVFLTKFSAFASLFFLATSFPALGGEFGDS